MSSPSHRQEMEAKVSELSANSARLAVELGLRWLDWLDWLADWLDGWWVGGFIGWLVGIFAY